MILKALRNGTALIQVEKEEKSKSGVYYPDDNIVREVAKVIQVAEDITLFKKGDRILFKTWAVNRYEIDSEKFSIINEEHCDGVL